MISGRGRRRACPAIKQSRQQSTNVTIIGEWLWLKGEERRLRVRCSRKPVDDAVQERVVAVAELRRSIDPVG
jgi:hypothetical protein